jgi:hypothetical protein
MKPDEPKERPNNEYNGYQLPNGLIVWMPLPPRSWRPVKEKEPVKSTT